MKTYIKTEIVQAEPMIEDNKPGYRIIHPDNYISWLSNNIFESIYHEIKIQKGGKVK